MKINLLRSIQGFLMTILLILTIVVQPATAASEPIAETQKSNYAPNEPIVVEYSNFPGNKSDWITVVPSDFADNKYAQWFYTQGSRSGSYRFNGLTVGDYQVRGYFNWSRGGYNVQTRSSFTVGEDKSLKYGESYHLENQWPLVHTYLGTCDKTYCVPTTKLNVFADAEPDLAGEGTGTWKLESATGASAGTPVSFGDLVYLQNQSYSESYLDICGLAGCSSTPKFTVVTDTERDPDGDRTGIWKIESATGEPEGNPVSVDDLIYLKNQWSVGQTYLDVDRIATCGSTTKLSVVTNPEPNQAGEGTGTWKIID